MVLISLLLAILIQTPVPAPAASAVVVGLVSGEQLSVTDATFSGFIETRDPGPSVLLYRRQNVHGELDLSTVQRIDLEYQKGKPFLLNVTLKNGQKLDMESDRRDFVTVKGPTASGTVIIKHPDPIAEPKRLSSRKANRKNDLTIQYLEFPR